VAGRSINEVAIDRFTGGHFLFGLALGALGASEGQAVAVAVGWELAEGPLKRIAPGAFPHPSQDSTANATMDALAMLSGWWATSR
jgi:hypothetical protein